MKKVFLNSVIVLFVVFMSLLSCENKTSANAADSNVDSVQNVVDSTAQTTDSAEQTVDSTVQTTDSANKK